MSWFKWFYLFLLYKSYWRFWLIWIWIRRKSKHWFKYLISLFKSSRLLLLKLWTLSDLIFMMILISSELRKMKWFIKFLKYFFVILRVAKLNILWFILHNIYVVGFSFALNRTESNWRYLVTINILIIFFESLCYPYE